MSNKIKKNILSILFPFFLSKIADYAFEILFVLVTLELTNGNYIQSAIVYFFRFIPFVLFGPIGGWLADSYDIKKNLMMGTCCRVFSILFLLLYTTKSNQIIILVISAVFNTIGRSIFQPNYQASIMKIVPNEHLKKVNGVSQILDELSLVIGPLFYSLMLFFGGRELAVYGILLLYICSLIVIFYCFSMESKSIKNKIQLNLKQVSMETINYLKDIRISNTPLYITVAGSSLCIFFTGATLKFGVPAYILSKGGNENLVSYFFSAMAIGTIIGGIAYLKFTPANTPKRLMILWCMYGLLMVMIPLNISCSLYLVIPSAFALGISGAFVDLMLTANIQTYTNSQNIGKNFAMFSTLANTAEAASGLTSSILSLVGIFLYMTGMSSLILIAGLYFLLKVSKHRTKL